MIETTGNIESNVLILTSGENPTLSLLELRGAMEALGIRGEIIDVSPQVIHLRSRSTLMSWKSVAGRTGYIQGIYRTLFDVLSLDRIIERDAKDARGGIFDIIYNALSSNSRTFLNWLPKESGIGIEAIRVQGSHSGISRTVIKRAVGKLITQNGGRIDLSHARAVVSIILSRNIYIGVRFGSADRSDMRRRRNQFRPFSLPISLSPNSSRALLNIARVKKGDRILDPFCGTGGILIEAAMMGVRIYGSDISEKMIEGTKENFHFFQLDYHELQALDIEEIPNVFPPMDAVVTDPPYGRSTSTRGEGMEQLYSRMFSAIERVLKPGGRCAIMLPSLSYLRSIPDEFELEHAVSFRVHKSLVRHFISLLKKG